MHFIQNSWFVVYSVWVLLFIMGTLGIIAYINNRNTIMKKVVVCFSITLIAAIFITLNSHQTNFVSKRTVSISEINHDNNEVEGSSLLNNAFQFLGSILRDKISN